MNTKKFLQSIILTEDDWNEEFRKLASQYREPQLVLYTDQVRSGCGIAGAQVGPFYCPTDQKAYIDLAFYNELKTRFRAPGDFAQAYVLAHEIGHHIHRLKQPGYRENREAFADEWRDELLMAFFKKHYWYLARVLNVYKRFLHPVFVRLFRRSPAEADPA